MEVMVALVVFVISVVGLVAMEARSIEAQRGAAEIRAAERIAQLEMQELESRGFYDLLSKDFVGNPNPSFPYADHPLGGAAVTPVNQRLRTFQRNFSAAPNDLTLGGVANNFLVFRRVNMVVDQNAVVGVSNPPLLPADDKNKWDPNQQQDIINILGVELEVVVMWIDRTNPSYPPPADAIIQNVQPDFIDPTSQNYKTWVGHVRLRTVRVNDIAMPNPNATPSP